jgi:hypothetical protein
MDTKMVREWFGKPWTTVEEGARHLERLVLSSDLDGVSGVYFDQDRPCRAMAQAYDKKARRRLKELSLNWAGVGEF